MTPSQMYTGTGNSFDLLNHVKYGLFKGLHKVCKEMKKDFKFGVVDFSDTTRYNGMDSFVRIFESRSHPIKNISLTPQCGGTCIDSRIFSRISRDLTPGKTIYTLVTDGEIYGDTTGLYTAIEHIVNQPKNAFVFVEINYNSAFGQRLNSLSRRNDALLHYSVRRIADIKSRLGRVLIKYKWTT